MIGKATIPRCDRLKRSRANGTSHAANAMAFVPLANGKSRAATSNGIQLRVFNGSFAKIMCVFSGGGSSWVCISGRFFFLDVFSKIRSPHPPRY